MRWSELIAEPAVRARWEKVRRWFFLRESTYDVTHRCDLRCDGCYYYEGEKQHAVEERDPERWRSLMRSEKERGITFVVLAGAEPALAPEVLRACWAELPRGCIATNGVKRIPDDVGYRLHVSVWGDDETSARVRGLPRLLERQIGNYAGDGRAVFVYTYTRENVSQAAPVVARLSEAGCRVTFNVFSSPVGYTGPLRHDAGSLRAVRASMLELLERHPESVLFSPYGAAVHTDRRGLHELLGCAYPRCNESTFIGLGRSFRQYRTDLGWDRGAACCVPDTDCADCRHYASGSAVVTARLQRHAVGHAVFRGWLDYVDTYLAVWVTGYEKGENLSREPAEPPGCADEGGRA